MQAQAKVQHQFINRITQGDCIQVIREMPANSVDFILTDPPYLVNYRDRDGRSIQNDVQADWLKPAMKEAYRVLKQNRVAVMFYGWTKVDAFFEAWKEAGFQPGSRMAALIPPVVNPRPMMTIRKFTSRNFTIDDLIERRALTAAQAKILTDHVRRGDNLLISGGTGSGKTTLTNVLSSLIPDGDRILILEDVAELYIKKPHVISAEAQLDTHKSQIGFADLLKAALRHRPDRIIVGEIRGPEARVFLDALNTGHRGSLSTIHANSATDALRRLAQLAMRGSGGNIPVRDVEEECERSIDLIVHVMNEDGWRHISEIRVVAAG